MYKAKKGDDASVADYMHDIADACAKTIGEWEDLRGAHPGEQYEHIRKIVVECASRRLTKHTQYDDEHYNQMRHDRERLLQRRGAATILGVRHAVDAPGAAYKCKRCDSLCAGRLLLRAQGAVFHMQNTDGELRIVFMQWKVVHCLRKVQRDMKRVQKEYVEQNKQSMGDQLNNAYRVRDMASCWRLARKIAGIGFGPRGRSRHHYVQAAPELEDWIHHLQKAGPDGGMMAQREDYHDQRMTSEDEYNSPTDDLVRDYISEYQEFLGYIKRASNRKAPRDDDAPAETWAMALMEEIPKLKMAGIGFVEEARHSYDNDLPRRVAWALGTIGTIGLSSRTSVADQQV